MQHIDIQRLQITSTKTRIKTAPAGDSALHEFVLQITSTKTRIKTICVCHNRMVLL